MWRDAVEDLRYCPKCAGNLVPRVLKEGEPARLVCATCGFILYLNPKVAACTIPLLDGQLVLLRRAGDPAPGKWVFPGGFVDHGEPVPAAAMRETLEEVHLKVSLTGVLDVYSSPGHDVVVIVYAADVVGGELAPGAEALEARAFAPEDLPWNDLAFDSTRAALRDYVRRYFPRVRAPRFSA
jgi:ADP-ribose pyrophosphatase YjhB (NUDIX family)